MENILYYESDSYDLYHHGIRGQKWGVRRYQNADGTLTSKGKQHVQSYKDKQIKKLDKAYSTGKYDKKISNYENKLVETFDSKKSQKYKEKIDANKFNKYVEEGKKAFQKTKISKMSLDDVHHDKIEIGKNYAVISGLNVIGSGSLMTTGFGFVVIPNDKIIRENVRMTNDDQRKVRDNARKKVDTERKKNN